MGDGAERQARSCDFNIYSKGKKTEKLNFLMRDRKAVNFTRDREAVNFMRDREAVNMHANPVKRGLVRHPKDWPWSSFSFYAKGKPGLAEIDAVDL